MDIAKDPIDQSKYKEAEDPSKFKSVKTGRGPLKDGWMVRIFEVTATDLLISSTSEF